MDSFPVSVSSALSRRQLLMRCGLGAAAFAVPSLLSACSGTSTASGSASSSAGTTKQGAASDAKIDKITWALPAETITGLDVATANDVVSLSVQSLALEGLLAMTNSLGVKPALAESWSQPDALTYVFKIRPGVKFWDGSLLTVEDVVFSMSRHMDPKVASELASYYENVHSIVATGSNEVTVNLSSPDPTFKYVTIYSYILSQSFAASAGQQLGRPGSSVSIMGTGAYRITSFVTNTSVSLEANPGYWGGSSLVSQATLTCIGDPQTRQLALQSGQVDGSFQVPPEEASQWAQGGNINILSSAGLEVAYMSFDLTQEPWNDIHVRRAFSYASDRQGYVKAFLGGYGTPANSLVPPAEWNGLLSQAEIDAFYKSLPTYSYDMAKAKQEMAASSHPDGFTASINVTNIIPEVMKTVEALSQTLKQLKINLVVNEVTSAQWLAGLYSRGNTGVQASLSSPDYADPSDYMADHYTGEYNLNTARYSNATFDSLLEKQAATTGTAARVSYLKQAITMAAEEIAYLAFFWEKPLVAVSSKYVYEGFNGLYYYQDWLSSLRAAQS